MDVMDFVMITCAVALGIFFGTVFIDSARNGRM